MNNSLLSNYDFEKLRSIFNLFESNKLILDVSSLPIEGIQIDLIGCPLLLNKKKLRELSRILSGMTTKSNGDICFTISNFPALIYRKYTHFEEYEWGGNRYSSRYLNDPKIIHIKWEDLLKDVPLIYKTDTAYKMWINSTDGFSKVMSKGLMLEFNEHSDL